MYTIALTRPITTEANNEEHVNSTLKKAKLF